MPSPDDSLEPKDNARTWCSSRGCLSIFSFLWEMCILKRKAACGLKLDLLIFPHLTNFIGPIKELVADIGAISHS